jgi:hypothetical protein
MKNLTWKIPVNWTRRAVVDVDAETFEEAADKMRELIEKHQHLGRVQEDAVDVPWSYEVDIDASDVYQTPEAIKRMFDNE